MVISSLILKGIVVIELYVKFVNVDGFGPSSTTVTVNMGTETKVGSPTTQLCGEFFGLLQSDYYDVPETFLGRHSSVSRIDLNFGGQSQLRTDNLLFSMGVSEGTSNTVLEGNNEGADGEGDVGEKEGAADANEGEVLEPEPIQTV
ncbi:hypothetical protein PVK06_002736 [Gossypium arboreum]|uniref:Uncharacterized protein n=1 Tax=Gossypium arboreum TaxID=29729 RepID=A0ABR0R4C6_GOSAR|nr:hypothetical protein PVK06_002736 [Gossypium arboreum]